MTKSAEIINTILDVVADEFEVTVDEILSKRRVMEIVDARHTAIKLMHIKGVYASRIAQVFGSTTRNINAVLTSYDNRQKGSVMVRNNYERLRRKLGKSAEVTI